MACNLLLLHEDNIILNKFKIGEEKHIRRKPYPLPDWIKKTHPTGVQTHDLRPP